MQIYTYRLKDAIKEFRLFGCELTTCTIIYDDVYGLMLRWGDTMAATKRQAAGLTNAIPRSTLNDEELYSVEFDSTSFLTVVCTHSIKLFPTSISLGHMFV
ncbi:hypothetical protein Ocin01_09118 [Orchesella cincta]|uniref:Uncharacterized protein n=1 Tax=Orchesella cincta TaxID=48709 RepID=A0A1D2MY16_ORCCI|nr:hypothetical protein Ocin01_09118 [Orchesella cincta]